MSRDTYQELTPKQQLELLDEVSRRRGLAPAILEKDYWVCRTLDALFALPELGPHLVFKGGTSLSKVYGLIDRFSEDIDVSFHREFLGFGDEENDPESASSNKDQRRRLEALQAACAERIREELLPTLNDRLADELGQPGRWSVEIDTSDPQTVLFHYPQAGTAGPDYIRPAVRIEMGARSDHWPREQHQIRSYVGEEVDQPIGIATAQVLAAERTFWEKATLLHAECHRDPEKPMPARYARHYHDLARMAASPVVEDALADSDLRKRVVAHKTIYFRSGWARYDLAHPGSFRLVPDDERLVELERDHEAMMEMFFTEPPALEGVLEVLRELERRINSLGA